MPEGMSFECKRFILLALLEKARTVLPSRDLVPVLKNFQVEAGERLRVVATDMDLSVISHTPMVNVKVPGIAVLPGKQLLEIVKSAPDTDIIITVNEGKVHIQADRTQWEIPVMTGDDYPIMPDPSDAEMTEIDREDFLDAINQVKRAIPTDTVRPQLMMICVREGKMCASDGSRMQQVEIDIPDMEIPSGAVEDLNKLLAQSEQEVVAVGMTENHLVFRTSGDTFIASRVNQEFPDIQDQLLRPAEIKNDEDLHIDREELMKAIRRVRVAADIETSAIILEISKGQCVVRARDKFGAWSEETLDAGYEGEKRELALNHVYLTDMLNMTDAKSCHFFLGSDTRTKRQPILLKDPEAGLTGLLTQLRIEMLTTGKSSGDSDFRKRVDGDYNTGKGGKDSRTNVALDVMVGTSEPG